MKRFAMALGLAVAGAPAFADQDAEWTCFGSSTCFNNSSVVTDDTGKMLAFVADFATKENGWVAIDCVEKVAAVPGFRAKFQPGSSVEAACNKWVQRPSN